MAIKIVNKSTDNPKLMSRELKDGRKSLYLLYNFGYSIEENGEYRKLSVRRTKQSLGLYLYSKPKTPMERKSNVETLALAYRIRDERIQQLMEDKEGYRIRLCNPDLLQFFSEFIEQENVADKRLLKGALENFRRFLKEEYPQLSDKVEAQQINPKMIQRFVWYLEDNHRGQGAETYYKRFKRLINHAIERNMMSRSPCKGIKPVIAGDLLSKDILSPEELETLFSIHYEGENPEVRRAFAFTCLSGVRYCDVVRLTYANVDYGNRLLKFRQHKVAGHSARSGMMIPLNDTLLDIVGKMPGNAGKNSPVFCLPSFTTCLKVLRVWTLKAGIDKHITWHCGRHSFATMMLGNGTNIKVVSDLLGHSNLQHTQVYLRAMDKQKKEALDSLPDIQP